MTQTRSMLPAAAIAATLLLSACAGPTQTRLSDGTLAYRIECESSVAGLNYCFERAGKSCGAEGYTIVDEDGSTITRSDAADTDAQALIRQQAEANKGILVKCGT